MGRWTGKGGLEIHQRIKDLFEKKYGKEMLETMLSPEYYQLTHNKLFPMTAFTSRTLEEGSATRTTEIFCLPILIEGVEYALTRVAALLE